MCVGSRRRTAIHFVVYYVNGVRGKKSEKSISGRHNDPRGAVWFGCFFFFFEPKTLLLSTGIYFQAAVVNSCYNGMYNGVYVIGIIGYSARVLEKSVVGTRA